ncbi:8603_t:CDS:1 [Paraglomus brasilianum]|uniref:8603_t:CDS:1 n=1 Tax=Paraglomus brasilianum TaxID=144538 RepID=A0A9N9CG47_9GLOM|nr:8603_t:CDS:1 [Paraglomus brasilianum]
MQTPKGPSESEKPGDYFGNCREKVLYGHTQTVRTVAWSSDGRFLASGSVDTTVRIWWTAEEDIIESWKLEGHRDSVDQLCWNPKNPSVLATASEDRTVRFWDVRADLSSVCRHAVETQGQNINISWSKDGNTVAIGDKDNIISFIDTRTYKIVNTYYEKKDDKKIEFNEMTWDHNCNLFYLTTGTGAIRVLRWPSLNVVHTLRGHTASCYCLEYDPKLRYLATGAADALVGLWDLSYWYMIRAFPGYEVVGKVRSSITKTPVRTLSFTHDGKYIASASEDQQIVLSEVETGDTIYRLPCGAATNSVSWHPNGYLLAYAGDEFSSDIDGRKYRGLKVYGYYD